MKRKPYSKRTDLEKLRSNWTKSRGLFDRGEFSLAIVRAATAVEVACNFAIRQELVVGHALPADFVDSLLVWANGINGKFTRLLFKITTDQRRKQVISIHESLKNLNKHRNAIAHRGEFKMESTARACLTAARDACHALVQHHESVFALKELDEPTSKSSAPRKARGRASRGQ
jgi:hypothetical protein